MAGGSSPLSRGIRVGCRRGTATAGIIPALAGNTSGSLTSGGQLMDHPRSRGEYTGPSRRRCTGRGSSPLSRGILGRRRRPRACERIIPALAGNTPAPRAAEGRCTDHPRSRGEYRRSRAAAVSRSGSSPLSRGILCYPAKQPSLYGIIPALAGNTAGRQNGAATKTDHPRSRGEYCR